MAAATGGKAAPTIPNPNLDRAWQSTWRHWGRARRRSRGDTGRLLTQATLPPLRRSAIFPTSLQPSRRLRLPLTAARSVSLPRRRGTICRGSCSTKEGDRRGRTGRELEVVRSGRRRQNPLCQLRLRRRRLRTGPVARVGSDRPPQ